MSFKEVEILRESNNKCTVTPMHRPPLLSIQVVGSTSLVDADRYVCSNPSNAC